MATQTAVFEGVNVQLWDVEFDIADTDFIVQHGISGPNFPILIPNDADSYTARVSTDGFGPNAVLLQKDAGTACSIFVLIIAQDADKIG